VSFFFPDSIEHSKKTRKSKKNVSLSLLTSIPLASSRYVATVISGFTSVACVTMPLTVTSDPMCGAPTDRSASGLLLPETEGRSKASYRRRRSGGRRFCGSATRPAAPGPPSASARAWRCRCVCGGRSEVFLFFFAAKKSEKREERSRRGSADDEVGRAS